MEFASKISSLLIALFLVSVSVAFSQNQKAVTLNEAIKEGASHFLKEIPENSNVAVLDFASPSKDVSDYINDVFSKNILDGKKVILVDRNNLEKTKQEFDLSLNMETSEDTALSIGHLVGARFIIFGSIKEMGNNYFLQIRGMEIETSRTLEIYLKHIQKKDFEKLFGKKKNDEPFDNNRVLSWLPHSISVGTTLATPFFLVSIYNNKGFGDYMFLNYGCDLGFVHRNPGAVQINGVTYYSFYPFINLGFHTAGNLRYFGKTGAGFLLANYIYEKAGTAHFYTPAFNIGGGISFKDMIELDYALRTNFKGVNHKIAIGFTIHY
ncbi:MAG: penicillin-binding protein activator LpoB [Treponema sp.]|jgi:hypothetical protein|nr:penicillin-binding protein activator LpoB [Treponema sp.]